MTFGFLVDSQKIMRLFCNVWEVFWIHGNDSFHCVFKFCFVEPRSTFARDSIGNSLGKLKVSRSKSVRFIRDSQKSIFIDHIYLWNHETCSACDAIKMNHVVLFRVLHFHSCFWILLSCEAKSLQQKLKLSSIGFSEYVLSLNTESCYAADERVRCRRQRRTRREFQVSQTKHRYFAIIFFFFISGEMWFLDRWISGLYTDIFKELPGKQNFDRFFKKHDFDGWVQWFTYVVASFLVSTSVLTIINGVGLLDVLAISHSKT